MKFEYVVYDENPRLRCYPPDERVVFVTTRREEAMAAAERFEYGRAYAFDAGGCCRCCRCCVGVLVRNGERVEIWPLPGGWVPGMPYRAL